MLLDTEITRHALSLPRTNYVRPGYNEDIRLKPSARSDSAHLNSTESDRKCS